MEDSSPAASTTSSSSANSNSNPNSNSTEVATYSYDEFSKEVNKYILKGRRGDAYRQIIRNIQTKLGHGNPIRDKLLAIINRVKDGAQLEDEEMQANVVSIFPDAVVEPIKMKPKVPKSTRVNVGRKNTEAINPSYIKTVADWVSYSDRKNVRLGRDGSLEVVGDDGQVKTIPFQKGFDAVRGVTMRSELLRKKAVERLEQLRETTKTTLSGLHDTFVGKERELLAATRAYRESVYGDADGSLARDVVRINRELSEIHIEILNAKYESVSEVRHEPYLRSQIYPETHDDRVIQIVQNTNMETTIRSRTLGLDGDPLKEPIKDLDEESESDNNDENDENGSSESPAASGESAASSSESAAAGGEPAAAGGEPAARGESAAAGGESAATSSSESASSSSESASNSSEASPDYFQELVDEIKTKLQTFTPTPEMTLRQLKAAIFTEERLAYYDTHIPDFKKRFGDAFIQADKL